MSIFWNKKTSGDKKKKEEREEEEEDGDGDGTAESQAAVVDSLPPSGIHSTRTVAFLPDGRMVVAVGSSCNVCDEADERRAAVVVYDGADGGGEGLFAAGLRNAVPV